MDTAKKVAIKGHQLDAVRIAFGRTLGPPRKRRGMGLGLIFAGLALGVMVERWGWRRVLGSALTVNRWATFAGSTLAPAVGFLNS